MDFDAVCVVNPSIMRTINVHPCDQGVFRNFWNTIPGLHFWCWPPTFYPRGKLCLYCVSAEGTIIKL